MQRLWQTRLWRTRLWQTLEPAAGGDWFSRAFDIFILSLILLNVTAALAGSVESIYEEYGAALDAFERLSLLIFCVEYFARLFSCTVDPRFSGFARGRLRFAMTPMALIDLVAILPFLLPFFIGDMRCLRALRLLRMMRIVKLARYVASLRLIGNVISSKREELAITTVIMVLLLVMSSSLMFQVENEVQPESFPNIPATMWWAVATLTTVGYGDVYPVTPWGKLLGAFVAILGIGFFALPTGILGSAFVEEIQKEKGLRCPHCGETIEG